MSSEGAVAEPGQSGSRRPGPEGAEGGALRKIVELLAERRREADGRVLRADEDDSCDERTVERLRNIAEGWYRAQEAVENFRRAEPAAGPSPDPAVTRAALEEALEALDQVWAAIGDRFLGGGPLSREYANAVARQVNTARDKLRAALRASREAPEAGGLPEEKR